MQKAIRLSRRARNPAIRFSAFAALLILPLFLWLLPLDTVVNMHSGCIFYAVTGHRCYGCGITRAVMNAIHGNWEAAWEYNKLVVVILPMLVWIWGVAIMKSYKKLVIQFPVHSNFKKFQSVINENLESGWD